VDPEIFRGPPNLYRTSPDSGSGSVPGAAPGSVPGAETENPLLLDNRGGRFCAGRLFAALYHTAPDVGNDCPPEAQFL